MSEADNILEETTYKHTKESFVNASLKLVDHTDLVFQHLYGSSPSNRTQLINCLENTFSFETSNSYELDCIDESTGLFDLFSPPERLLDSVQSCYSLLNIVCSDVIFNDLRDDLFNDRDVIEAVQIIIKAYFRLRLDFSFDGDHYFVSTLKPAYDFETNWKIVDIHASLKHIESFQISLLKLDEADLSLNMSLPRSKGSIVKNSFKLINQLKDRRNNLKTTKRYKSFKAKAVTSEALHKLAGSRVKSVKNETTDYVDSITMELLLLDVSQSNEEQVEFKPTKYFVSNSSIIPDYTSYEDLSRLLFNITEYCDIPKSRCLDYLSEHAAIPKNYVEKIIVGERVLCLPQAIRLDSALYKLANLPAQKYRPFFILSNVSLILSAQNSTLGKKRAEIARLFNKSQHLKSWLL